MDPIIYPQDKLSGRVSASEERSQAGETQKICKAAPYVFAIDQPHQFEETIGYLSWESVT